MTRKPYGGFFRYKDETILVNSAIVKWSRSKPNTLHLHVDDERITFDVSPMVCMSYQGPESFKNYYFSPEEQSMFDESRFRFDGTDFRGGGAYVTCLDFLPEKELVVFEIKLEFVGPQTNHVISMRGGLRAHLKQVD
jgi:hypothetical protein